jgi:ribokinase
MAEPTILVVGSINMDLVVRAPHMPAPGETILGDGFTTAPGGKGANQAVAVARLGARCHFLGRVGDDEFGKTLLAGLVHEGIHTEGVRLTHDAPTGVAMIIVDEKGENSIVVASGANHRVTPDDIFEHESLFAAADVVVMQLELPIVTTVAARKLAAKHHKPVILDPAPARKNLPADLLGVDIISPNLTEAEILTGQQADEVSERVDKVMAADLLRMGAKAAVLKLGHRGSLVLTSEGLIASIKPYKVDIVDTTAAGDAFTAALAVGVAKGMDLPAAARMANAAGALACTRFGAQASMPTIHEVKMLMGEQK